MLSSLAPMQTATNNDPIEVSVVIPTRNRPQLVLKAANSALEQDFAGNLEVIVVIDGEDARAQTALRAVSDPRLRIVALSVNVGGSEARNIGVRAARGRWIAFLDDDDEWFPRKLSLQLEAARQSGALYPVVSSRLFLCTPSGDCVRPLRSFNPTHPVSEYLFCRSSFADSACALQTSTLFAPRALLLNIPFLAGLRRHQDWDWVLRVECEPGVQFLVLDSPLTMHRVEDARSSVGRAQDWEFSFLWSQIMRDHFTPRAYGWFLASECASRAAKSGASLFARLRIAQRYLFDGGPSPHSAVMLAFFLLVPGFLRQVFHAMIRTHHVHGRVRGMVVAPLPEAAHIEA